MSAETSGDTARGSTQQVKPVVTIFEQYGAGANDIGQRVAAALGLPYRAQAFTSEDLEPGSPASLDSRATLARVLSTMGGAYGGFDGRDIVTTQQEKRDLVTNNTRQVWEMADEGGVIVGRNAAIILANRPNTIHVLLTGEVKDRIARAAKEAGIPVERAAKRQHAEDDVRAQMSIVLYGWDPREPQHYDLVLNTSRIPASATAAAIVDALRAEEE